MKASAGFLYPVIFALGTTIPMLIIIILLVLGKSNTKSSVKLIRKLQKSLKIIGGSILLVVGIIDTLIYWFQ
jgi:cytochrome c biogenesis protein CcdA